MKTCEKCGNIFNNEYAFCPNCGAKAASTPQDLPQGPEICGSCGAIIRRGLAVCPKCGAQTGHSKTPEPTAYQATEPMSYQAPEPTAYQATEPMSYQAPEPTAYQTPDPAAYQATEPMSYQMPDPAAYQAPGSAANQTSGSVPAPADANPAAAAAAAVTKVLPKDFSANSILKNKKLVIGGILAAAVIIVIALISYSSPRDLNINAGEDIEAYFNEPELLFVYPEGMNLAESYDNDIEWTFDHPELTKIEDGTIVVTYDKNAFNASESDSVSDSGDDNTFTTTIHGKLKKGLRNWEGDAKVVVSLQEPIYFNGMVYVDPEASKDSYVEVKASSQYSTYFYFKSQTDPANDISFIVDKGTETTVYVPCDTYEIYEASGQTWYGPEIVFGPKTFYSKSKETLKFTPENYWRIELGVFGGNSESEDINSSDFPDSEAEVY